MSDVTAIANGRDAGIGAADLTGGLPADYVSLLKPRVMSLVILTALWFGLRAGRYGPRNMNGLESGAAYWHMVDLVWLILFPLVYVIH